MIDLLITDFSKTGGLTQGFAGSVSRLNNAAGRVIDDTSASEEMRNLAIDAETVVAEENSRLDNVTVRAAAVLQQLRRASGELSSVMAEELSIAQIRQLGGDIKTLADAARVVTGS